MGDLQLTELQLEVSIVDATTEDVDQVTRQLLSELREMDVEWAQLVEAGPAPRGSKAVESITIGSIAIATLPALLPKIVEAVQTWALRGTNRTVKFKGKVGSQAIEFEGSGEDLQKVLAHLPSEQSKR